MGFGRPITLQTALKQKWLLSRKITRFIQFFKNNGPKILQNPLHQTGAQAKLNTQSRILAIHRVFQAKLSTESANAAGSTEFSHPHLCLPFTASWSQPNTDGPSVRTKTLRWAWQHCSYYTFNNDDTAVLQSRPTNAKRTPSDSIKRSSPVHAVSTQRLHWISSLSG